MSEWDKLDAWGTTSRAATQSNNKKVPSPNLLSLPTTNGVHCSGDGIKLALGAGSDTYDLHCVQIHPTGLVDPSERDAKVKFLAAEALRGSGAIILDKNGKRFADELGKRDYVTGRMWLHGQAPYRLCLNSASAKKIMWHCEHYEGRGLMTKMSGADLAKACNVSKSELQKEFDVYNKASKNPGTDKWDKKFFESVPVESSDNFYVAEITPVIHYCMGGVAGNDKAEVLKPNTEKIPGLYVAGEALGGVHGVNRLGGSSLLDCVVYGRVAGREATKYLLENILQNGTVGSGSSKEVNLKINPNDKSVTVSWGDSSNTSGKKSENNYGDDGEDVGEDPNQAFYSQGVKSDEKGAPAAAAGGSKKITFDEMKQHTTDKDCWVALHGKVFNLAEFLDDHPGGKKAIMLYAGKDATKEFDMLHKIDIIDKYAMDYYIGDLAEGAAKL